MFNTFKYLLSNCSTFVTPVQLIPICQPVLTTGMKELVYILWWLLLYTLCHVFCLLCWKFSFVTFIKLLPICQAVHTTTVYANTYHIVIFTICHFWYLQMFAMLNISHLSHPYSFSPSTNLSWQQQWQS